VKEQGWAKKEGELRLMLDQITAKMSSFEANLRATEEIGRLSQLQLEDMRE
jgi:hypothetical protein